MTQRNVIVTLTSWTKRIETCHHAIRSILEGLRLPDKIVLNLSKEEFEGIRLPQSIIDLQTSYEGVFEIYWVEGPNTKTFKKLLPTLDRYPNDIVISIDDDIIYPENFIKDLVEAFEKDPTRPITVAYNSMEGVPYPWGGGSLYVSEFLHGYKDHLTQDIIETYEDDWFYGMMTSLNGIKFRIAPSSICYSQSTYRTFSQDTENYYNHFYTIRIISKHLEALGESFISLADKLYEKYGSSI